MVGDDDLTVSDEYFGEQFPLSPLDDYMIHQTPDPIRVMWTGDFRAYERYWMVCHDPTGEVLVATGGSFYPNLDRAEAFAIVSHGGRHTTVRGFRPLGVDRADMRIGPIAPRGVGGPACAFGGRLNVGVSGNAFVAFPSWKLWGDRVYYPFGDRRAGSARVGKPTRWLRFEPDTNIFVEGIVEYPLDTGEVRKVHYERIGQQTAYLRCGMYGGTPDGDIHQGG